MKVFVEDCVFGIYCAEGVELENFPRVGDGRVKTKVDTFGRGGVHSFSFINIVKRVSNATKCTKTSVVRFSVVEFFKLRDWSS